MFDKIIEKIKDKIAEWLIVLLLALLSAIWLAIPSELKERYTDTSEKKLLLGVASLLILLVLSLLAWIYKLRKRLKIKDELSKDELISSLKDEKSELQNQLQECHTKTKQLEDQLHKLTHIETLDDMRILILLIFAEYESRDIYELEESLTYQLNQVGKPTISQAAIQHHLDVLERQPLTYITAFGMPLHKDIRFLKTVGNISLRTICCKFHFISGESESSDSNSSNSGGMTPVRTASSYNIIPLAVRHDFSLSFNVLIYLPRRERL